MGPRALSCWILNPTKEERVPSSFKMVHSTCIHCDQTPLKRPKWRRSGKEKCSCEDDDYFDLSNGDQKTFLNLGVQAENASCPPEVEVSGC